MKNGTFPFIFSRGEEHLGPLVRQKSACSQVGYRVAIHLACWVALLVSALPMRAQDNNCPDYDCPKEVKKIALVIGNANYVNLSRLPGATTDADEMTKRLTELGFEVVRYDDVRTPFQFWEEIVPVFRQKLTTGDFIVFYFSGHGFSVGADSFLAPTELPLSTTVQHVTDIAIAVESFKAYLETHSPGLILFVLDSCRSFGSLTITPNAAATENLIAKGPAEMQRRNTAVNTVIAFATKPGEIALGSSQAGQLSPFTRALVENITTEGKSFDKVFRKAAADLELLTDPPQKAGRFDWSHTDPYLKPTQQNLEEEKEAWQSAFKSSDPQIRFRNVKLFVHLNSVSRYVSAARRWIADQVTRDLKGGFTRASPLAIDRAWRSSSESMVAIRRLSIPLAFTRSVSEDKKPELRELADPEVGLVPSGINTAEIAALTTGESFVASIAGNKTVPKEFFRSSLAYSLANIDAHGTMVATRPLLGRAAPKSTAKIIEHIPARTLLQIRSVLLSRGNNVWVEAASGQGSTPFYFKIEPTETAEVLELGHSIKEILVPGRPNSLPQLVDPAPIKAAIAELKAQGWKITWISLSTAATTDETEQDIRAARIANAEYILKHSDIPLFVSKGDRADVGERITSVSGRTGFSGDAVRIRFYGIK